ncbi:MAG: hypothetical protein MNPFHGCM_03273 [Gemmatimonadaceae bacterium]|nr:hypothetical protein [Gemmatimonadaceae bacterium]
MKHRVTLTVTSLSAILLFSFHQADDVVRGMSSGGLENLIGVAILVLWLFGTLVLADRRSGLVIILLGSLFGAAMPVIHLKGAGVGGAVARSSGALLFIWTLLALGVTGTFAAILAVRGLSALRRGRADRHTTSTAA